ncbi:MAG: tetratricopeptide repeat protein [SAR86 cluster bacterium]|nr:tetratricopeptide repeat protein [SAR86 cluster bacterium]
MKKFLINFLIVFISINLVPMLVEVSPIDFKSNSLFAADDNKAKTKKKRKRTKLPSRKAQKVFQQLQPLIEADLWTESADLLSQIRYDREDIYTGTDRATAWYYYGYIYFSQEKFKEAINAYQSLIDEPDGDYRQKNNALYSLSQLAYIQEDYRLAVKYLIRWLDEEEFPSSDAYALLAQGYYQLKDWYKAIDAIQVAIDIQEAKDIPILDEEGNETKKTRKGVGAENHYLLKMALYSETKQKLDPLPIYEILVTHYPKKLYWVGLAGLYGDRDRLLDQQGALEAAFDDGLLDKSAEFVALSQLLMMHQNPYKAAKVLNAGIKIEAVKQDEKNLKRLAQAWHAARELDKAVPIYSRAAKLSKEGELYIFLGQVHFALDDYKDAEKAIKEGIKKGKLKDPATAHMLLGQINFENQKWEDAVTSFRKCIDVAEKQYSDKKKKQKEKKKKVQDSARKWITYTMGEEERVVALDLKRKALGI